MNVRITWKFFFIPITSAKKFRKICIKKMFTQICKFATGYVVFWRIQKKDFRGSHKVPFPGQGCKLTNLFKFQPSFKTFVITSRPTCAILKQDTIKYIFCSTQEVANFRNYLKRFFHAYFKHAKLLKFFWKNYKWKKKILIKNNFSYLFKSCKYNAYVKYYFSLCK